MTSASWAPVSSIAATSEGPVGDRGDVVQRFGDAPEHDPMPIPAANSIASHEPYRSSAGSLVMPSTMSP